MTNYVTTTCRDINELLPEAKQACLLFFKECFLAGIDVFITETYRSQERQNYLYEQGRTRPGNVVTWTRVSQHKSRLAWDVGAVQNAKSNYNIYDTATLKKAGTISNKLGITWGGNWVNNLDYPHHEVPRGWKPKAGHSLDGYTVVPSTSSKQVSTVTKNGGVVKPTTPPPTTTKPPVKEEEQVKILTIGDATNHTTKTKLRADIVRAMDAGLIKDPKHLAAFDNGTMNAVDVALIGNYVNGNPVIMTLSTTFRNFIVEAIDLGIKKGVINRKEWLDEAKSGWVTIADANMLLAYMSARGVALQQIPSNKAFFKDKILKGRKEAELSKEEKQLLADNEAGKLSTVDVEVLLISK